MHLVTIFLTLAPALAVPLTHLSANIERSSGPVCAAGLLYTQAQCCDANVMNVADLDCKPAPRPYSGHDDFKAACASEGRSPQCCTIPVAGFGVLCNDV